MSGEGEQVAAEKAGAKLISGILDDPHAFGLPEGADGAGAADHAGLATEPRAGEPPGVPGPKDQPPRQYDSRGREIPPGVKRLPSGKLPSNFSYAGKVYKPADWPADLKAKYPDGVTFTNDGFPDFGPHATHTVTFEGGFAGDRTDFAQANAKAGTVTDPAYTWHHHQDGITMQRVPRDLHDGVRHAGGVAIVKGRRKP